MSLQSQLTRLARNVGALTADTNAIFEALRAKGVNVPANAQLSDVADMIDSLQPEPSPTPSYDYILLNQFINPMPSTVHGMDFDNTIPVDFTDNTFKYQIDDLVSLNAGDAMIDTDKPIDFSSKGIASGTPCGIINMNNPKYEWVSGASYGLSQSLSNGCTIECWYKVNYDTGEYSPRLFVLGISENQYGSLESPEILLAPECSGGELGYTINLILFDSNYDRHFYASTIQNPWNDGNWHHYAISYNAVSEEIYIFFDGTKINTITENMPIFTSLFSKAQSLHVGDNDGNTGPVGRYAQLAVCAECKWDNDFIVPTTAY